MVLLTEVTKLYTGSSKDEIFFKNYVGTPVLTPAETAGTLWSCR